MPSSHCTHCTQHAHRGVKSIRTAVACDAAVVSAKGNIVATFLYFQSLSAYEKWQEDRWKYLMVISCNFARFSKLTVFPQHSREKWRKVTKSRVKAGVKTHSVLVLLLLRRLPNAVQLHGLVSPGATWHP